ncbi:phosphoribosylpyrophosphate synthetase [Cryomorpha ignava]|uniref:Phosphoribosylpyrophosphate synthetase n=1 Tax=Cryomorpha ignava TaxID=101383 RepID=A0A7K3WQT3_9FLAO|nr:phosphoribosylpyrophosphate synthetase [Cryomorpha ignava]NEN23814.1 phosphoribosylpyrophosphate synthetase [Cryomorpha ignava]
MTKANSKASYDTLSEATNALIKEGYVEDLNLKPDCLECLTSKLQLHPEDFEVDAFYRFEGMSNADDNSIVYAITGNNGTKGILVDAYGVYSSSLNEAMIQKLKMTA